MLLFFLVPRNEKNVINSDIHIYKELLYDITTLCIFPMLININCTLLHHALFLLIVYLVIELVKN